MTNNEMSTLICSLRRKTGPRQGKQPQSSRHRPDTFLHPSLSTETERQSPGKSETVTLTGLLIPPLLLSGLHFGCSIRVQLYIMFLDISRTVELATL